MGETRGKGEAKGLAKEKGKCISLFWSNGGTREAQSLLLLLSLSDVFGERLGVLRMHTLHDQRLHTSWTFPVTSWVPYQVAAIRLVLHQYRGVLVGLVVDWNATKLPFEQLARLLELMGTLFDDDETREAVVLLFANTDSDADLTISLFIRETYYPRASERLLCLRKEASPSNWCEAAK